MKIEEYAEQLVNQGIFDHLIDELYWDGGFDGDVLFARMLSYAKRDGVEWSWEEESEFKYDNFFWHVWQNTEKGLS